MRDRNTADLLSHLQARYCRSTKGRHTHFACRGIKKGLEGIIPGQSLNQWVWPTVQSWDKREASASHVVEGGSMGGQLEQTAPHTQWMEVAWGAAGADCASHAVNGGSTGRGEQLEQTVTAKERAASLQRWAGHWQWRILNDNKVGFYLGDNGECY